MAFGEDELEIPQRTTSLDHHWEFMKSWLQNSNPEAVQQIVDIVNGESDANFLVMVNEYPDRAHLMKSFARLAIYEADYRIRLRIADEQQSSGLEPT